MRPGCASRSSSMPVACVAARYDSTPRATTGAIHHHSSAVMMPSRPNTVLNHGTPAYGYAPYGVSVNSISTSASDRLSQLLNGTLDDSIRAPVESVVLRDCTAPSAASYDPTVTAPS